MAAGSSSEISSSIGARDSNAPREENPLQSGIDLLPAATDFIFRFDVDFYQLHGCTHRQLHVYSLQEPVAETSVIFSTSFVENHPIIFALRGTPSDFAIYPPTLPKEIAIPSEKPLLSVKFQISYAVFV